MPLISLPYEILCEIFSFTNPRSLLKYIQTCKASSQQNFQIVWKYFLHRQIKIWNCHFNQIPITDYKLVYLKLREAVKNISFYEYKCSAGAIIKNLLVIIFPNKDN